MGSVPPSHLFDATQKMQDAGLVAVSAAGTNIIDLEKGAASGAPVGLRRGKVVLDVTALEIASGDEAYTIHVQGSPDAAFGTTGNIVELASLHLGAKGTKLSDCDRDDATGRRTILFENTREDGTPLRYLRLYITVAGDIATGINFTAYHVPIDMAA